MSCRRKILAPPSNPRKGTSPPAHTTSLVLMFDELTRNNKVMTEGTERPFLKFVKSQESRQQQWEVAEKELGSVRFELEKCEQEVRKLEIKLSKARDLLSAETTLRKRVERERDVLLHLWGLVRELISTGQGAQTINDDTRVRMQKLEASISGRLGMGNFSPPGSGVALSPVNNSTCSILDASDLSYDNTQGSRLGADDIIRRSGRPVVKRRSGGGIGQTGWQETTASSSAWYDANQSLEAVTTSRKSVNGGPLAARHTTFNSRKKDQFVPSAPEEDLECHLNTRKMEHQPSTTTLTPSEASTTTLVSTSSSSSSLVRLTSSNIGNMRKHTFVQKNSFRSTEKCGPCGKRIKFGKVCLKCVECRVVAHHPNCEDMVPLPCVPAGQKALTSKGRVLVDFTPNTSPVVPDLIKTTAVPR